MLTRRRILMMCACGLVCATLFFVCHHTAEPAYNGRSLSAWLDECCKSRQHDDPIPAPAQHAVRQIGTNAIPLYLKWIQYEYRPTKSKAEKLLDHLPQAVAENFLAPAFSQEPALNRSDYAVEGLLTLGPAASEAVPELTRLLNGTNTFAADQAARALSVLGTRAIPPLLQALGDPDRHSRQRAISAFAHMRYLGTNISPAIPLLIEQALHQEGSAVAALGALHLEPETVVPVLTNCLMTSNQSLRYRSMAALAWFGTNAAPSIPAIIQVLADPDSNLRYMAADTLKQIAPDLQTNVPPH